MKKLILMGAIFALALSSCMTDEPNAKRLLESEGYTNIEFTGYNCFECSEDDWYSTGFEATNSNGNHVKGTVCAGMWKGKTIRFD